MSYCDFNNAFKNMNEKFLETFDGITSEDLSFNVVNSEDFSFDDKNNIRSDVTRNNIRSDVTRNNIQPNIISNNENLYGTSIQHLTDKNTNYKNNSCNSNNNITLNNNKLTHRECIHLYLNPNDNKNPNYELAHRHIIICSLCQNEINKKVQESFEIVNSDNPKVVDKTSVIQNVSASNQTFTNQSNVNSENKVVSLSMRDLEVLLKNITERTSEDDKSEHFSRIIKKLDDNERNKPLCIELNFLNVAISLLIILLLIDIVLRLKK